MKLLRVVWAILRNVIAVCLFIAMLEVCKNGFEKLVVSSLGLIYATMIYYLTAIIRLQIGSAFSRTDQFLKLQKSIAIDADNSDLMAALKSEIEQLQDRNAEYYINMAFVGVISLTSIVYIVSVVVA